MNRPIVHLNEVVREYDDGGLRALDGVSLSVNTGESVAITGASGSGKSTLLAIIGALDFATSGSVCVAGEEIAAKGRWDSFRNRTIGFVFQLFHLIPEYSLVENVELALRPQNIARGERRARAEAMLRTVGLSKKMSSLPCNVSGGERQRAAVARALVSEPKIVLADEPTGNLDSKTGGVILDLLQGLSVGSGRTLILVTHNRDFASRMSRTVELRDGRIV